MKAIILAAGIGRRLYPITETVPKSMIQLNGKPIIQYKIDALKAAGIHDIVVVVGHLKEVLKASLPKDITIIYNDKFRTTNNMYSLWLAREHTKDGFMLLNADVIHDNEIIRRVVEAGYSLIAVDSSRSNIKELNVSCDQNLTINRVEFNLPQEVIYGESAQIMKLDKNDAQVFMRNVNMQMGLGKLDTPVSVIPQELLKHMDLKAFDISQYQWREIDDHFDLNIASMVA
ncbi:MAG: phosphocholine cytidylyltransferase family protein, partial [Nanoarchaeota archaeon]|nr:phosphocholine cytidylyltransferase family protein [Nanoarchaeota archaeon]